MATVYTQSSSGGLYTQDKLKTSITLKENTKAHLTTQASTIVHKSTNGPTSLLTNIVSEKNSLFEYLPDPMIMLPYSELDTKVHIRVSGSSNLIITDSFLVHDFLDQNRHFNRLASEVIIQDSKSNPLVIDRFSITGEEFFDAINKFSNRFSCHATMIIFFPKTNIDLLLSESRNTINNLKSVFANASELPYQTGVSIRILARDAITLKLAMSSLWKTSRYFLYGEYPNDRRK